MGTALAVQRQGLGAVSADQLNTFTQSCDTVLQLRGLVGVPGIEIHVRGIAAPGDGGAGPFFWNASSIAADDGRSIIVPVGAGGTGCWQRLGYYTGQLNAAAGVNLFGTRVAFAASGIAGGISSVSVNACSTPGDGGRAVFYRLPSAPTPVTAADTQTLDGAWWRATGSPLDARALFVPAGGTTEAYAALVAADVACATLGVPLVLSAVYKISTSYTFTSPIVFASGGRLVAGTNVLLGFGAGLTMPLAAFTLDLSASGAGLTGRVVGFCITPQNVGAVGNNTGVDDGPALVRAFNVAAATGLPFNLTATRFTAKSQVVWDHGPVGEKVGVFVYGQGVRSEIAFDPGVASPNLKVTDLTGVLSPGANQYAVFYGEHRDFQVSGNAYANGTTPTPYVRVLQYGEGNSLPNGDTTVYFNGLKIRNVVVKNNAVNGGGYAVLMSGMTDCDIDMTCNCGGAFYDGSVAMVLQNCAFNRFGGSCGNAQTGIFFGGTGPNYANQFDAYDLEVLKIGIQVSSQYAANNIYHGTFATMDYCIASFTNSGGIVLNQCQYGGIGSQAPAGFTASIAGTTMTVTTATAGTIVPGSAIAGAGVTSGTLVVFQLSGTTGGTGTYQLNYGQTVSSENMTATYGSIIQAYSSTGGNFGGYGVTIKQANGNLLFSPNPQTAPSIITVPASGTWTRNIWGQDANVFCFGSADLQVYVRDWFDQSGSGERVLIANNGMVSVKAGESIQIVYTSAATWVWRPAVQ